MLFWFALRSPSILRFVEPVIEPLSERGHQVVVSFDLVDGDPQQELGQLSYRLGIPVTRLQLPDPGIRSARSLLLLRALASYATLRKRWPPLLRERWLGWFPAPLGSLIRLLDRAGLGFVIDARLTRELLTRAAAVSPVPATLRRQLAAIGPDVVVVSPAVYPDSREIDVVRAARDAGIPSLGIVLSWDNLTSKGIFHARPDRLIVWNEAQVREAADWHGFASECVDIVGAPAFDYLFEREREIERASFLERMGLPVDAGYILYGGSSSLGLGPAGEVEIVRQLATAIAKAQWKGSRPPFVLVRPHPNNARGWDSLSLPGVVIWKDHGFPTTEERRSDLYNGLHHADAVVGLNTSLFIDAAIADRPAIAITMRHHPHAARMPSRVVHFAHLESAGFLELVDDPGAAAAVLARLAAGHDELSQARRDFVSRFVRPAGLERSAADVLADRLASPL